MKVTHENSQIIYNHLIENPPIGPMVPLKPSRKDQYAIGGKNIVAVVRANNRMKGITEALLMIGGIKKLCEGVKGKIVIKPNCNTDDPFPRCVHSDTIRFIAENLIQAGFPAKSIVVGDMSGGHRGLPTRHTMENMGLKEIADELGIQLISFEKEEWVTVKPPNSKFWPNGIKIPKCIYDAERVILSPVMRPHRAATFSLSLKVNVGCIDAVQRQWMHNGENFYEKMIEINLAVPTDLVVTDGMKIYVDEGPDLKELVEPGIIIVGSNRVVTDALSVAVMKYYGAYGMKEKPVLHHKQFELAEKYGLGTPKLDKMIMKTANLVDDENFETLISEIRFELGEKKESI